jgi:hypothetical protein
VPDEDSPWYVQLAVAAAVLVGVAVLICGLLAVFGFGAARLVGYPTSSTSTTKSLPTSPATESPTPQGHRHSHRTSGGAHHRHSGTPAAHAITLTANPGQAARFEHISLSGSYLAPDGTTLQVQRRDASGWSSFPVTASVSGGNFSTYILTGHTGTNRFRVIDLRTKNTSNAVTVHIG